MSQGCVTTPISVQCHRCKQCRGCVLADLTTSALPAEKKKKSEIVSWPVSRPHLGCLLDCPANRPGADTLHMAHNLFLLLSSSFSQRPEQQCIRNSFVPTLLCLPLVLSPFSHTEGFQVPLRKFLCLALDFCTSLDNMRSVFYVGGKDGTGCSQIYGSVVMYQL